MINVDAGFDVDCGEGSTGVVIRDSTGGFIVGACRVFFFFFGKE